MRNSRTRLKQTIQFYCSGEMRIHGYCFRNKEKKSNSLTLKEENHHPQAGHRHKDGGIMKLTMPH
jgi:hypothetical protein